VTWQPHIFSIPPLHPVPSFWGPSDEELNDARSYRFSASSDSPRSVDQLGGKDDDDSDEFEVEDDEDMDDHFGHLFDLAEAAHLADVYHTDEGTDTTEPLLNDITIHEGSTPNTSTSNSSPRKRSRL
jgi:hypothetical protein